MKLLLFLIFSLILGNTYGQKKADVKQQGMDYSKYFVIPKLYINKDSTFITNKDYYHPHLHESLSEAEIDSLRKVIHQRKQLYTTDSVTVTEHYFIWKPLIDRLNYEDPHYWVIPQAIIKDKKVNDILRVVPVSVLIINDTVIVDRTCSDLFQKGDRLLSVNGTPVEEYLGIGPGHYMIFADLQQYRHFDFSPYYKVEIERKGKKMVIETEGVKYGKAKYELSKASWAQEIFDEEKTGYFAIDEFFPNNSLIINKLSKFVKTVQKKGYKNIIIDTRRNPGGSGHNFDIVFSLFINKDTIPYIAGNKIRVSEFTIPMYDLPKDSIGKLIDMPEKYTFRKVPLRPKKYLGEMNYYILISKNTISMAASFANVLQYNGVATLVGEPLLHNALKYGEVIQTSWTCPTNIVVYSTVMTNEYTRSKDGQIYPDIEIPYIAREYMEREDPMLEKLLEYIKKNN